MEAIDSSTAVVAVPNVHWTDGTYFDLIELGRRCRDVGAALVVDATQSVAPAITPAKSMRHVTLHSLFEEGWVMAQPGIV